MLAGDFVRRLRLEPLPISQIHLVAQMIQIEANRPAKLRKGDVAPMKRTILMMAMVIGCGISSPTFGFDLLDRMLGIKCGSSCDTAACDAPADCEAEPACGCEEPACGCEAPAGEEGPACGCEEPVCGCEPAAEGCATRAIHLLQKAAVDYSRNCSQ